MTGEMVRRIGEVFAITHRVSADAAFTVTSAAMTIYNAAGTAVVTAGAGTASPAFGNSATQHDLTYLWNTSALLDTNAGDYTYSFRYVVGSETRTTDPMSVTLLPATSKYDRYVFRTAGVLQDADQGGISELLSYRDYMACLDEATRELSRVRPARVLYDLALTANTYEYLLSLLTSWVTGVSQIIQVNYPWDTTTQSRPILWTGALVADELAATPKLRFVDISPSTGQTARILYTGRYSLSHTLDTVPTDDFEPTCLYAAALALRRLQSSRAGTTDPAIGAGNVIPRTQSQEYASAAREMERLGRAGWRKVTVSI
jgi:hypothetical protein